MFESRSDAAAKLAEALIKYRGRNPLVLGVPRGAVPMARSIADRLGGEVDVVLVRKLGAPSNPEFAIGAVDEMGAVVLDARNMAYAARTTLCRGGNAASARTDAQATQPIHRATRSHRPAGRT